MAKKGVKQSEEHIRKRSYKLKGRHWKISEESKKNIGLGHKGLKYKCNRKGRGKGRIFSEETKKKMSKAKKMMTNETKMKISLARKGKISNAKI